MTREIFISYMHKEAYTHGFGNAYITTVAPSITREVIVEWEKLLENKYQGQRIAIMFFRILGDAEE